MMDAIAFGAIMLILLAYVSWEAFLGLMGGSTARTPRRRRPPREDGNAAFVEAVMTARPERVTITFASWAPLTNGLPHGAQLVFRMDVPGRPLVTRYSLRSPGHETDPAKRALALLAESAVWRARHAPSPPTVVFAAIRRPAEVIVRGSEAARIVASG